MNRKRLMKIISVVTVSGYMLSPANFAFASPLLHNEKQIPTREAVQKNKEAKGEKLKENLTYSKSLKKVELTHKIETKSHEINEGKKENNKNLVLKGTIENQNNLSESSILIKNVWNWSIANISFNTKTMKLQVETWNTETNPYAQKSEDLFSITLINKDGIPIKTVQVNGSSYAANAISKAFNGVNFNYGDKIVINYKESSQIYVNKYIEKGKTIDNYRIKKPVVMNIEKNGLENFADENLNVDSLPIEGTGEKITKTNVKGITTPETNIKILVNGKSFTGKSNYVGTFDIPINDNNGIKGTTKITVCAQGQAPKIIYPTSVPNLGISKSSIGTAYNAGLTAETLSFNTNDSRIKVNSYGGKQFSASLINSDGMQISSLESDNFSGFDSNANLNGSTYNYGDILSVYQTNQSEINWGNIYLNNNGQKNNLKTDTFNYFKITENGLVPVANKNLVLENVAYNGGKYIKVSGKTIENTNVVITYNGQKQVVKSNGKGQFVAKIDKADISVGQVISIFVNKNNFKQLVLKDSSKYALGESKIQISNQYGKPLFYIGFNQEKNGFVAKKNIIYNNYSGAPQSGNNIGTFYTNSLEFKILDNETGKVIDTINTEKLNDISTFTKAFNNKTYKNGQIIEVVYNKNYLGVMATNKGKEIQNNNDGNEYFEITNSGLVNITKEFIEKHNIENLDNYSKLNYSYINFYNNVWAQDSLISSIGFNPKSMKITIENYKDSFGNGTENYFNIGVKNSKGEEVVPETEVKNGTTKELTNLLNGVNFNYGDIITLTYNNKLSIPVIVNGNNVIGNINGSKECFKITKNGLVRINLTENKKVSKEKENVIFKNSNDIEKYSENLNGAIGKEIESTKNISNSINNVALLDKITVNAFINRVGVQNLENIYNESTKNAQFVDWLLNNNIAMTEYLNATNISGINLNSIKIWSNIWNTYTNSHEGFNLKLAIAVALSNATPITDCYNGKNVGSPVERYNIFETLNADGGMYKEFESLNVKLLEAVVDLPLENSQILEMRAILLQNHNQLVWGKSLSSTDYTINYNFKNPYNGAIIFGSWKDFYGKNSTIADVWKDGGVCGSISRLGSLACRVFGQPSHQMGEPGHDAFYTYNFNGTWSSKYGETTISNATGFDVSGWSSKLAISPYVVTYNLLYDKANNGNLELSNKYIWVANAVHTYKLKINALNEAIKIQPLNVEAWLAKINLIKENKNATAKEYVDLGNNIIETFKDYPTPMFDLLVQFNKNMSENTTINQYNKFVSNLTNALEKEINTGNESEKVAAQRILNNNISKYGFTITEVKETKNGKEYLSNGKILKGWQNIKGQTYYLGNDGIAESGFKVIKGQTYYFNKQGEMQTNWQEIDGNKYYFSNTGEMATGLQKIDGKEYVFTNKGIEIENIIKDTNIKIYSYSTEQNNTSYSANNVIDGNINTTWQNDWNGRDKAPYITVEFNKPYKINTIGCMPRQNGQYNGDIEQYKIYTSMNGKDFKEVKEGTWTYDSPKEIQSVNLNGIEAKYIKIESVKGYCGLATIGELYFGEKTVSNKSINHNKNIIPSKIVKPNKVIEPNKVVKPASKIINKNKIEKNTSNKNEVKKKENINNKNEASQNESIWIKIKKFLSSIMQGI